MDENWQKVQIPLDSVIDSNMADMLRLVSDPALIFNRQVLQGGYLPTSLRFEKNGWFCGIYGYDYDVSSPDGLEDDMKWMPLMQVERQQTYVSTAYSIKSDEDNGGQVNFIYYPLTRVLTYASSKEPEVQWVPDDNGHLNIVEVKGKTHDFGRDYTFYIDMTAALDGDGDPEVAKDADWVVVDPDAAIDFDGDGDPDIDNSFLFDHRRFVYSYTVYDKDQSFTDSLILHYAMPFYIGSEVHEMSFDGSKFTYGDSDIVTVSAAAWPQGNEVEAWSSSLCIDAVQPVITGQGNLCAVDLSGSISLEVDDNLSAITETYYTDINLNQCVLSSQQSIGRASSATVLRNSESVQVPLVAAGFVCLGTSCPFYAKNVYWTPDCDDFNNSHLASHVCTGYNTYAQCISGAVPVWSAQTIWLLRFFGDDIFYYGQYAAESGIVALFVPQQSFAGGWGCGSGDVSILTDPCWSQCCSACAQSPVDYYDSMGCPVYKQYYCTVYGNKQYSWVDPISKSHSFSSCGQFYVGSVNQCNACANFKQCVAICVPLVYDATGQSVDTQVCILLDTMTNLMQVQSVGCIVSVTADPKGFSSGNFSQCTPFAPLPGSLPQFIVHEPYRVNINNYQASNTLINTVLNKISACSTDFAMGRSVCDSLRNKQCALFNYWNTNGFFANMQITPITVVYPTAGWFQSYVSFKGLRSKECVDRSRLDNPEQTMLCVDTPYCSQESGATCCLELICSFNASSSFTICNNFALGGQIVIQSSNGCNGEKGETSWWARQEGTCDICYHLGRGGKGGSSGIGFCVNYNYPLYNPNSPNVCCGNCSGISLAPGGAGGGGGAPGVLAAYPSVDCPALQQFSETWTQGEGPIDYDVSVCCIVEGSNGGCGGKGSSITITLPQSGKPYFFNCDSCCACSMSSLTLNVTSCQNCGSDGSMHCDGCTCWCLCVCECCIECTCTYTVECPAYDEHGDPIYCCDEHGCICCDGDGNPIQCCIECTETCTYYVCECYDCWQSPEIQPGSCNCGGKGADSPYCSSPGTCHSGGSSAYCDVLHFGPDGCCCGSVTLDVASSQISDCFGSTICYSQGAQGQGSCIDCECDVCNACVFVYACRCCTDYNYDIVNLQNEDNCFGIHLCCNCLKVSNFLMCCSDEPCTELRALELVPYLSDGYIYIASSADALPAWSTSLALTKYEFWCDCNESNYSAQFMGEYVGRDELIQIHCAFENGVCLVLQSTNGCGGSLNTGGSSGYSVCISGCYVDCADGQTKAFQTIVPGGAGGGGGGSGGEGAVYRVGPYSYSTAAGFNGANGSGLPGQCMTIDMKHCCVYNLKICIVCQSAMGSSGADAYVFGCNCYAACPLNYSGAGTSGLPGLVYFGPGLERQATPGCPGGSAAKTFNASGATYKSSVDCFVRVYGYQKIKSPEPWAMSNDFAQATRLGGACGMTPQLQVPLKMCCIDRLVDVTVSTSHEACYNLSTLAGTCATDTSVQFCKPCCGDVCCYCIPADWTRDTGIYCGKHINLFVGVMHGCSYGGCPFDYGICYDIDNKCFMGQAYDRCMSPITYLWNNNYTVGRFDLGGYSGCLECDPPQVGYTTNSCATRFDVEMVQNNAATEPFMNVTWCGKYKFCTRMALPYVENSQDTPSCYCRDGVLASYAKGAYFIGYNQNSGHLTFNECQHSVSSDIYSVGISCSEETCACQPGCACLCVCGADFDCGTFTLKGIYKNTGSETLCMAGIDDSFLTLDYADCGCTKISIEDILNNKTFLDITATNVNCSVHDKDGNDNTNETKIASIEMNSEYQIVKQKWDTTIETENIWWLDKNHILELTPDKLVITQKLFDPETGAPLLDDWNGDQWGSHSEAMRSDLIDSTVIRYGVSSVYGNTAEERHGALFWTVNVLDTAHFRLNVYLPLEGFRRAFSKTFTIKELNYGEDMPYEKDVLGMYTSMEAHALVSQADISATHVGYHFIIGFHIDSCLRQWSFLFETNGWEPVKKITGYGYVAPNGSLTGGQFPEQHVSRDYGFFGAVKFINDLSNYHNSSVDGDFSMTGVYGTQEQQWYLYKDIKKICSHFTFSEHADVKNGGRSTPLTAKWLPVQSNYSAVYSSPSFMLNKMTGFLPTPTTLASIFDFGLGAIDTLIGILSTIACPSIWFLNICWIKFGFLQQTIGQFAYTYKTTDRDIDVDTNSIELANASNDKTSYTSDPVQQLLQAYKDNDKTLTRDSLSFDKQEFEQTCTTKSSSNEGVSSFWIAVMQAGIGGLNNFANSNKPKANSTLGKTTPSDVARAFSQFAIENALNVSSAGLGANAVDNIMLASKVTAVKTLDMFYSTSSNSNMYAGPGYVCHNMIGYCIAQSMSNRLLAGTQSSMFTVLSFLSTLSYMFRTAILKSLSDLMDGISTAMIGSAVYALGSGTTFGNMIAAGMQGGKYVSDRLIELNKFFLDITPKLLQAVCPGFPSPKFNLVPGLSQHDIDIEAKHTYGSKHCLFMWPCFGCESTYFTKESVKAVIKDVPVKIDFTPQNNSIAGTGRGERTMYTQAIANVTDSANELFKHTLYADVHSHYAYAQGSSTVDNVPADMAVVEGTSSFLPTVPFKNENIDIDSSFTIPPIQDYMVDSEWQIGKTAGPTGVLWTSVKDTKIIDGDTSNVVITDDSALIASTYVAVEVKKQISTDYIRPVAVTPNALAWNMTGLNVSYDSEMKHGFDGVGYRLVHWAGSSGMGTEYLTLEYCFFDNDHLKRSNKLQPNRFWGSFTSLPTVANKADFNDGLYHQFEIDAKGIGTEQLTPSENKNTMRNAIPLFTEQLCTMPAVVKALSSYRLDVVHGITSLATQGRTTQGRYKIPKSIDFNINKHLYRATDEYVNELNEQGLPVGEVVAKMGLEFIGATPTQAFFYSEATRAYYSFVGANTITKQDVWNRFKDIKDGKWDFVNQNVVFQCIGNMSRIMDNADDNDNDLVDNIFIGTMSGEKNGITGEITPPNRAVFDNESWFKTYSFAGGVTFQGPNRYIVNRFICLDYMIDDIVANKGKWKKVPRNVFDPYRKYNEEFKAVNDRIGDSNDYTYTEASEYDPEAVYYYQNDEGKWKRAYAMTEEKFNEGTYYTRELTKVVEGWTHNPFLLATAPLGLNEDTDCMFEWQLTFTWTDEMDKLYGQNDYACVNIMAQTMCPGGKKRCEPTHLFLHKGLFTRGDNSGYYSFKFSSRNGAGNREQLFVWSDAYIAMTGLSLSYKVVTERRTSPLSVEQNEVQEMEEF